MNDATVANLVLATAIGAGVPAIVALLWRIGNKVAVLGERLTELSDRVSKLERRWYNHHRSARRAAK